MNVQTPIPSAKMTIDAFFAWSESQVARYELVDGDVRMLPWVKRGHSTIVSNIDFAIQSRLDRRAYTVHQGDFAIPTGSSSIRYADLIVEPKSQAVHERTADDAFLIVEVLSDSTMHIDFGAKKDEYLNLPTVQVYWIVAQDHRQVWVWERGEDGNWPAEPLIATEGDVAVIRLNLSIPIAEIYEGLAFD